MSISVPSKFPSVYVQPYYGMLAISSPLIGPIADYVSTRTIECGIGGRCEHESWAFGICSDRRWSERPSTPIRTLALGCIRVGVACISTLAPKSVERRSDKVRLVAYKGLANNRRADARPLYTRDRYRFIPYATAQCKRVDGYTCSSLGRSEMDTRHGLQEATASNQGRSGNPRRLATLVPAYGMVAHEW